MPKTLHSPHSDLLPTRLRELREARGLRQQDLADRLGHSQAMVSNVERGERRLDVMELHQWLQALGVDFMRFVRQLDEELREQAATPLNIAKAKPKRRPHRSSRQDALRVIAAVGELIEQAKSKPAVADA
ncbi:helix-turn-helix domain-containing protein [Roseateles sp. NT4]|uniref:helix-turn-helix domain-containing protein n=1 Tax=Roseateles sp. NT4 TaxID=3453715 RepID=UPI003EF05B96